MMTPEEEMEAQIKADGIQAGEWQEVEEHSARMGGLNPDVEGLTKLRDTLEAIAETDRKKILELKMKVAQMRRGGGR